MPKALVIYPAGHGPIEQVARAIYGGASETGLETTLLSTEHPVDVSGYDLIFLGSGVYGLGKFDSKIMAAVHAGHWAGKRACVFSTHSGRGKAHVEAVGNELGKKNAKLAGTIAIQLHGLASVIGRGKPSETDMVRAFAFGERQAYDLLGRRPAKEQEKRRIKGYRK